jgi:hypothetical protein
MDRGTTPEAEMRLFPKLMIVLLLVLVCGFDQQKSLAQPATTVQLPQFGVFIDADGVLTAKAEAVDQRQFQALVEAARNAAEGNPLQEGADIRIVSLKHLNAAAAKAEVADEAFLLAGLTRVQYTIITADDILLAGPAEGWFVDPLGRARGIETGKPILRLDDLAVALRAFAHSGEGAERIAVGCSIDPPPEGLVRLQKFQGTIPRTIPNGQRAAAAIAISEGIATALGDANIRVFGISPKTHAAAALIEADYRMKRIGVGLEPPPVKMMTFMNALRTAEESRLQRWWFVPDYETVRISKDGLAMEVTGQGVQLRGEDKVIGPGGQLLEGRAEISKAAEMYCTSFTSKYEEIAAADPVYAELRNVTDMLIASAFLNKSDAWRKIGWSPDNLLREDVYAVEKFVAPQTAPCVANAVWKGARLLAPAGGGVSIAPLQALTKSNLQPATETSEAAVAAIIAAEKAKAIGWWNGN